MAKDTASKFGLGVLLGAAAGAVAAMFLSPRSGKENRELAIAEWDRFKKFLDEKKEVADKRVREIYGEVNEKSRSVYAELKTQTQKKLGDLETAIEKMDAESYKKSVGEIIEKLKDNAEASAEQLDKSRSYLMSYLSKTRKAIDEKEKADAEKKDRTN